MEKSPQILEKHLTYCFDTLLNCLKNNAPEPLPYPANLPDYNLPLFITWEFTKDKSLRGCIGNLRSC